jgi:opacity protein-like surface antigen
MKKYIIEIALLAAGFLNLSVAQLDAAAPEVSGLESNKPTNLWSFDIVPYLWLATYDGSFDLPGAPAGIPRTQSTSADPFSTHISAVAMLTAHVRYRDLGLYLDGAWLQLKTEGDFQSDLYSSTDIKSDIAYGTAALTYRLPPVGKLKTDLLAGARVWYAANEIQFNPGTASGFTTDDSRTWCDPIVGASLHYDLTKHWYGVVLGDVGGFGVGADLSWNVFGGVGYQFTSWCSATLGYRYVHEDFENNGFLMNANVQGFLLGVGFHF